MTPPPPGLSERDVSYLKLLKTLKQAPDITEGALGVVRRLAEWIDSVAVLNFICTHQAWLDDWEVKEGLVHNDLTPARWRAEIEKSIAIFDLLREMDDPALSAQDKAEIQDDIKYLFKTLAEHDRAVVKEHAYTLSASRRGKTGPSVPGSPSPAWPSPASRPAPSHVLGAEPASAQAPADATPAEASAEAHDAEDAADLLLGDVTAAIRDAEMEALHATDSGSFHLETPQVEDPTAEAPPEPDAEGGATLAHMPVEGRAALARASSDAKLLGLLAFDSADAVLLSLLDNPALDDRMAATVARRASARVAEAVYRHRRIFMRPLVREALLECANAPSVALLEVVNSISDFNQLLRLIKSPKIKFLEVKAKARGRLSMMFKSLGMAEKVSAIRRAGSSLLKELWTDFFRDEALVAQCVAEKSLDPSIILEIARSKIAPRRALELIAANAQYVANYQICLELVMNPKTPRQVVTKLLPKLNATDRKMIKNNPAIPEAIRRFA